MKNKFLCLILGHDKAYEFSMEHGVGKLFCIRCGKVFK